MRPRVFPAENGVLDRHRVLCGFASMRPRVFPAENAPGQGSIADAESHRFNLGFPIWLWYFYPSE